MENWKKIPHDSTIWDCLEDGAEEQEEGGKRGWWRYESLPGTAFTYETSLDNQLFCIFIHPDKKDSCSNLCLNEEVVAYSYAMLLLYFN